MIVDLLTFQSFDSCVGVRRARRASTWENPTSPLFLLSMVLLPELLPNLLLFMMSFYSCFSIENQLTHHIFLLKNGT